MMAEKFYTILTKVGKAKIANNTALGTRLNLVKFQLGDGGGSYYNPTEDQEELKHKVWEGNISSITVDKENPNWIIIQTLLPSGIGGFMIREAGIFDSEGNLIAIGKYPETYKPIASDGSTKDLIIKMILEVSNTSSVTLKVDPTVILATQKDIQILNNKIENIKVPVQFVNGKTGNVELKAQDIKTNDNMSLEEFKENVTTQYKDIKTKTEQVFQSGVEAKQNVVTALTSKKLNVTTENTWDEISDKIKGIKLGDYSIGDIIKNEKLVPHYERILSNQYNLNYKHENKLYLFVEDTQNKNIIYGVIKDTKKIKKINLETNEVILEFDWDMQSVDSIDIYANYVYIANNNIIKKYDKNTGTFLSSYNITNARMSSGMRLKVVNEKLFIGNDSYTFAIFDDTGKRIMDDFHNGNARINDIVVWKGVILRIKYTSYNSSTYLEILDYAGKEIKKFRLFASTNTARKINVFENEILIGSTPNGTFYGSNRLFRIKYDKGFNFIEKSINCYMDVFSYKGDVLYGASLYDGNFYSIEKDGSLKEILRIKGLIYMSKGDGMYSLTNDAIYSFYNSEKTGYKIIK